MSVSTVFMGALVACTQPTGTSTPTVTSQPCPAIDLRTPRGSPVNLSGTWEGATGSYQVIQNGSCVWWVAQEVPNDIGLDFVLAFRGQVASDFTIRGEYAFVYVAFDASRPTGQVVYQIEFAQSADGEEVTLRKLSQTGPPLTPGYRSPQIADTLHRAE